LGEDWVRGSKDRGELQNQLNLSCHSDEGQNLSNVKNSFIIKEITKNYLKNNLIKYSELELEYIKNFLETYKLSPSDLNTFLENPLKFLHFVVFNYPFEDNKYTIF
jgi:hypothetical protein